MRLLVCLAGCAVFASACTEQEILRYQDRPAETALECQAAYQAAKQRGNGQSATYSGGASALGASIGRGLAKGMIESSYRQCLARVANSGDGAATPAPSDSARARVEAELRQTQTANRPVGCPRDASVFYGGTSYCVGQR